MKGIDAYKGQGDIDFRKVKEAGYDFVIIQAGFGKYEHQKDICFERNYANARAAGLHVGAYWYSYAETVADARREAELFCEIIKGKQFDMPVAYDVETETQSRLSPALIGEMIETFCSYVENKGYYVSLYSYQSFLENKVPAAVRSKYDIWLASFGVSEPSYSGTYGIWQYSETGRVPGIGVNTDLDIAYKDYPTIIKEAGLNGYEKPAPAEPEPPSEPAKDFPKGDLNGDGKVDIEDVAALVNHINGVKPLE